MTLDAKSMGWLNHNRFRSYPMEREAWRDAVGAGSPLDCVLLDAVVFDATDGSEGRALVMTECDVGDDHTDARFSYGDIPFSVRLEGGETSGEASFESCRMTLEVDDSGVPVCLSMVFSSHAFVLEAAGRGRRTMRVPAMPSRIVRIPGGHGLDAIHVGGSAGAAGGGDVSGDVVLEDGFRTKSVVRDGAILVKVGPGYGKEPCGSDPDAEDQCSNLMFFFCGQNATGSKSGNVALSGGRGVTVSQGEYRGTPCVEIVADSELMSIYRPGLLNFDIE